MRWIEITDRVSIFGRSWLFYLNFIFLQWFFVRLAKVYNVDSEGNLLNEKGFTFLKWVIPLTGWWNDYKFV